MTLKESGPDHRVVWTSNSEVEGKTCGNKANDWLVKTKLHPFLDNSTGKSLVRGQLVVVTGSA